MTISPNLFSLKEVLVRIKAISRRTAKPKNDTVENHLINVGELTINDIAKTVKIKR